MQINAKIKNPIYIVKNDQNVYLAFPEENVSFDSGILLEEEYFGFTYLVNEDGKQIECSCATQCPIAGIEIKDDILKVYEEGKYFPWKIDNKGNILEKAVFSQFFRYDLRYAYKYFRANAEEIEELNQYDEENIKIKQLNK